MPQSFSIVRNPSHTCASQLLLSGPALRTLSFPSLALML
ncbi:hypothetical protein ASZ90_014860 [hydrocarbon metagenome]|uniref:Uncharacterized protein n=1 Tax=hydrocarbon metagenome TaxID=938273 RepID=A0A0W8F3P3_9ZZZZ